MLQKLNFEMNHFNQKHIKNKFIRILQYVNFSVISTFFFTALQNIDTF